MAWVAGKARDIAGGHTFTLPAKKSRGLEDERNDGDDGVDGGVLLARCESGRVVVVGVPLPDLRTLDVLPPSTPIITIIRPLARPTMSPRRPGWTADLSGTIHRSSAPSFSYTPIQR